MTEPIHFVGGPLDGLALPENLSFAGGVQFELTAYGLVLYQGSEYRLYELDPTMGHGTEPMKPYRVAVFRERAS